MALDKIARITRAKLDSAANDPDGSPQARISAASDLLKFDLEKNQRVTARTERTCHSVMAKFLKYSSASLGVQRAVRTAADHLREDLETALKAQPAQPEEDDAAIPMAHPSPQSTPVAGEQPLIGGQELLPDPNNEREWTQLMVGLGHYRLLTKSELLASIDIPLWIGERETTNRKPVNIAAPGSLPIYLADSELGWKDSRDMAVEATDAARALYFAELNELVHTRLHELGIATPAGVFVPLEELSAALDVAYQKLEPPYVTFEKVPVSRLYGNRVSPSDPDATLRVVLGLTDTGEKKRFINLLKARIRHGFDLYGRKRKEEKVA